MDEVFLQWFPTYDEARAAIDGFDVVIKKDKRFKGWKVSRPRQLKGEREGYALYAIPPGQADSGR